MPGPIYLGIWTEILFSASESPEKFCTQFIENNWNSIMENKQTLRKPPWLRAKLPSGDNFKAMQQHRLGADLATVCEEANCPNMGECWNSGTATFMLMGDTCTRSCRFCAVKTSRNPPPLDSQEPQRLSGALKDLNLKYIVLTTVDRDDLPDHGANHIAKCVAEIRTILPDVLVEMLIPDFQGKAELIAEVVQAGPQIIGHNLECVKSLTPKVRDPRASYDQSLAVLRITRQIEPSVHTKSSLMLGFGESDDEVLQAMRDLRDLETDFLTLGQYLQPSKNKLPVFEYVHPDKFKWFEQEGLKMGFAYVASGPLVRSSYLAAENFMRSKLGKNHCSSHRKL